MRIGRYPCSLGGIQANVTDLATTCARSADVSEMYLTQANAQATYVTQATLAANYPTRAEVVAMDAAIQAGLEVSGTIVCTHAMTRCCLVCMYVCMCVSVCVWLLVLRVPVWVILSCNPALMWSLKNTAMLTQPCAFMAVVCLYPLQYPRVHCVPVLCRNWPT